MSAEDDACNRVAELALNDRAVRAPAHRGAPSPRPATRRHARLRPRACGARCAARAPAQVAGRLLAEALARNPAAVAAVGSPDVHRAWC